MPSVSAHCPRVVRRRVARMIILYYYNIPGDPFNARHACYRFIDVFENMNSRDRKLFFFTNFYWVYLSFFAVSFFFFFERQTIFLLFHVTKLSNLDELFMT